ncbi:hypothetical protein ACG7TL_006810 [Trametes sanguinea]
MSIPTLRELYKAGVLKGTADAAKARHPPKQALLDRVSLYQGDITKLDVDAIVNAANRSLLGRKLNGCETGDAKITKGYNLPATSLQLAVQNSLKHIVRVLSNMLQMAAKRYYQAFPSISTGIYGYPIQDATHIALDVVRNFLDSEDGAKLERTIFVVWSDDDKRVYENLLPLYFPLEPGDSAA